MRSPVAAPICAALVLVAAACDLPETVIPGGESVVVVHAVMRPDLDVQFVVVERSFDGVIDPDVPLGVIPPSRPQAPVAGAVVTVENLSTPGGACGTTVTFRPSSSRGGVYWSPTGCPAMQTGDRLALRVVTPEGEEVTGVTRVPGMSNVEVAVRSEAVSLPAVAAPVLNRDRDTLRVSVTPIVGRLLQVELRRWEDLSDWGTMILADTTALRLPGDVVDVFQTAYGYAVFLPGRSYALTVGLADTNYFDFTRSANNEILGRGFINHLEGGIGVFGSLVAAGTRLWVVGDVNDPREGPYRLSGTLEGVPVDLTLTVYLADDLQTTSLSAFADGQWVRGGPTGPEGAWEWNPAALAGFSVDGSFDGDAFSVTILTRTGAVTDISHWMVKGTRMPGAPFAVAVSDSAPLHPLPVGSLTATQQ